MYLIVGLGNPEEDYSKTRHNMGFNVINKISEEYQIPINKNKFKGLLGQGIIEKQKVLLLKPQTFMNLSGDSVQEVMNFYKIAPEELIVIYDDIDLEPGKIRIRKNGSAGTHNGMRSIVSSINSENFPRIRVGIGRPKDNTDLITHVIGPISKEDQLLLEEGINKAKNALIEILKNDISKAMNLYN